MGNSLPFGRQTTRQEAIVPYFTLQQRRIHYREQGQGELLLILPGNTASSACHLAELEHFGQRYHAAALDYLGTGQSERLATWPATWWQDGAHQAAALADHLGAERLWAVGTSGGAIVALWMAILYPQRVRGLVADSTLQVFPPELVRHNVTLDRAQRSEGQVAFWRHAHGEDWAQVVEADTALIEGLGASGGHWLEGRLSEVTCPVLITASRQDDLLPGVAADSQRMLAQMPQARLYLHHEGGHPLMWSQAATFRAQADLFLQGFAQR